MPCAILSIQNAFRLISLVFLLPRTRSLPSKSASATTRSADAASHAQRARSLHLVIRGVGGGLVQEIDGLLVQLHELALEGKVGNACDVLFALAEVVLEKEGERAGGVEECAFDGHLLDVVGLGELEGLRGLQVGCSAEVEVVTVQEDFECLGSGIGRAGTDKNGVQADLAGEAFMKESGALAMRHPGTPEKQNILTGRT